MTEKQTERLLNTLTDIARHLSRLASAMETLEEKHPPLEVDDCRDIED